MIEIAPIEIIKIVLDVAIIAGLAYCAYKIRDYYLEVSKYRYELCDYNHEVNNYRNQLCDYHRVVQLATGANPAKTDPELVKEWIYKRSILAKRCPKWIAYNNAIKATGHLGD